MQCKLKLKIEKLPNYLGSRVFKSADLLEEDPVRSRMKIYVDCTEIAGLVRLLQRGSLFQIKLPVTAIISNDP